MGEHKRKRHKYKRRWRKKYSDGPKLQRVVQRFPRLKTTKEVEILVKLGKLREEYPPPHYDSWRDGSWNPAEWIFSNLLIIDIGRLRRHMVYHGLSNSGDRFELLKRLYLHWRSSKLGFGFPYISYGEGFERVCRPQCACGIHLANSKKIKRFPRLAPQRFPRTKRFPRILRLPRFYYQRKYWRMDEWNFIAQFKDYWRWRTGQKLTNDDLVGVWEYAGVQLW